MTKTQAEEIVGFFYLCVCVSWVLYSVYSLILYYSGVINTVVWVGTFIATPALGLMFLYFLVTAFIVLSKSEEESKNDA